MNLVGPPAQRLCHTLIDIDVCTIDKTRRDKKNVVPVLLMRVELTGEEPTLRDVRDTMSGEAFQRAASR